MTAVVGCRYAGIFHRAAWYSGCREIPGRWAPTIYSIIICPLNHPATVGYRLLLITALSAVLHMNCSPETACVGFCAVWILPVRFCLFVGWFMPLLRLAVDRQEGALSSLEVCMLDCSSSGVLFFFSFARSVYLFYFVARTSWKYRDMLLMVDGLGKWCFLFPHTRVYFTEIINL